VSHSSGGEEYQKAILDQIPRVLSRMDRDPYSPTAGCCDRTFWAWKFTDFPGSRFQEAVCVLSFVYVTEFEGNTYYRNPNLLRWIHTALKYWSSIQYRDGSFDEAYPFERSLAAVAFTTFYVSEAVAFLANDLSEDVAKSVRESIRRAGDWLSKNDETHGFLSNHLAASAAALYHAFLQTGESRFRDRSGYFLNRILRHQSSEGWYEEYGGADPGYQTHGTFYLARLFELDPQASLKESLGRAIAFQALFIHPDRSLGGEYTSRNTQTYYPAAFEMLADKLPAAAWIAQTMRPVVGGASAAGVRGIDAYNLFPLLNNLIFAFRAYRMPGRAVPQPQEPSAGDVVWLRQAGIGRFQRESYVAYVGASKGGVMKVFDRRSRRLVYSDCGYLGRQRDGKPVATQHFDPNRPADVDSEKVSLKSSVVRISRPVMNPWMFLGFRIFSLTVGQSAAFARWLKQILVNVLIYRKQSIGVEMHRTIEFQDNRIIVRDRFDGPGLGNLSDLRWAPSFTTIHMGSSRYFVEHELNNLGFEQEQSEPADFSSGRVIERTVQFK